jgi:hypothetical protein
MRWTWASATSPRRTNSSSRRRSSLRGTTISKMMVTRRMMTGRRVKIRRWHQMKRTALKRRKRSMMVVRFPLIATPMSLRTSRRRKRRQEMMRMPTTRSHTLTL